jgi:DNA-binding LacI/PurR family transcriptional regulator
LNFQTVAAGLTEEAGYQAGRELLGATNRPTAVFAVNDMAALGVLSAAGDLGLAVPRDLSLAGYDDTPAARLRAVGLTSVDNASREAGRVAARLLGEAIAGASNGPESILLEPQLRARSSTAAPSLS